MRPGAVRPERALLLALLDRTALDLHGPSQRHRADALDWLRAESEDDVFGFLNVCRALDLAPSWVRHVLLEGITDEGRADGTDRC
jgi:hypothetical protein